MAGTPLHACHELRSLVDEVTFPGQGTSVPLIHNEWVSSPYTMTSFSQLFRRTPTPGAPAPVASTELSKFSNLAGTAFKRHIQSLHESGDRRNPDILAGALLSAERQQQARQLQPEALEAMRRDAYYHYLTARTKFHDQALLDAVADGIRRIMIVGSGLDTRFHRFGGHLAALDVRVAECDQPEAIAAKQQLAAQLPYADRIRYIGVDLNRPDSCETMWHWLRAESTPALVIAEGVSPYIGETCFRDFLGTLRQSCPGSSRFNYDFKVAGVDDDFGKALESEQPFRLPLDEPAIARMHAELGYRKASLTPSASLMNIHVPSWNEDVSALFAQDAMIQLVF